MRRSNGCIVGHGYIENVEPAVWLYEVSGKQVVPHWFSYQKEEPRAPDHRRPAAAVATRRNSAQSLARQNTRTELLNLLNVLGLLVELEPAQADLLEKVCSGPLISHEELSAAGALELPPKAKKKARPKRKLLGQVCSTLTLSIESRLAPAGMLPQPLPVKRQTTTRHPNQVTCSECK